MPVGEVLLGKRVEGKSLTTRSWCHEICNLNDVHQPTLSEVRESGNEYFNSRRAAIKLA